MADGLGEITIERSLEQIKQGISDIGTAARGIDKDLKAVNAGLRLDPTNTELLTQKQVLLAQKLENSKDRSNELKTAIEELNRIKAENGQLTDGQAKLLTTYEQQLKETQIQVTALTGATRKQVETNKEAEDSTKSFSQSMTEFQSNLRAVNQVMSGLTNAFLLFGGDRDSAMYKTLQQGQQVVQMLTGLASAGKLLQNQNLLTAGSFGNLTLSAGAAFGSFALVDSLLNNLSGTTRTAVGVIITALAAGTIAWVAFHGAMSAGIKIPIILAAIGAGIAGVKAMFPKSETGAIETPTTSTPGVSTPSVPSYSGGGGTGSVTVQTLSQRQIEDAFYVAGTRIVLEQGLNDPKIIARTSVTRREMLREIFSGILDPRTGTISAREVL